MNQHNSQDGENEELFWRLADDLLQHPAVTRGTIMGFACLRFEERFFASIDRRTTAMIVKLPAGRVMKLVGEGAAEPFMPNGRVFKEWASLPSPDEQHWSALLDEAMEFAKNA